MKTKAKQKSWFRRHWILTMVIILFILGGIGAMFQDTDNSGNTNSQVTESKQYAEVDLYDLFFLFVSRDSALTDIQKEEQFKQYKNKLVKTSGVVKDIDNVMLSDNIVVSIISPENQFMRAATIYFDSSEKSKLLQISPYDEIEFNGRIETYSGLMGIVIKDAKLK